MARWSNPPPTCGELQTEQTVPARHYECRASPHGHHTRRASPSAFAAHLICAHDTAPTTEHTARWGSCVRAHRAAASPPPSRHGALAQPATRRPPPGPNRRTCPHTPTHNHPKPVLPLSEKDNGDRAAPLSPGQLRREGHNGASKNRAAGPHRADIRPLRDGRQLGVKA